MKEAKIVDEVTGKTGENVNVENKTIKKDIIDRAIRAMKSNPKFDKLSPAERRHTVHRVLRILAKTDADWWMDATYGEKDFFMFVITDMVYNEIELKQQIQVLDKKEIERLNEEVAESS